MKVLVTDDDLISRMALIDLLGNLPDLFIVEADSGERAWELLSAGLEPDLCCCDVRMPGMSGIDLVRKMRDEPRFAKIPVLMVTSASDRETVAEAIKLGAAGFIVKPFQADKVQAKIRETLGAELAAKFEDPAVAIKRLGISAARYVTYLEALAGQIDSAILKAEGGGSGTALGKQGLDALHTGCLTLGATYCAAVINAAAKSAATGPLSKEQLTAIRELSQMLEKHAAAVRAGGN
ncbi:MAG: response regulator [Rhodocyclaceae bacterium]|nr:response regulator [Rhodocyclaceae bacterium]